jgi:hypothetical protein
MLIPKFIDNFFGKNRREYYLDLIIFTTFLTSIFSGLPSWIYSFYKLELFEFMSESICSSGSLLVSYDNSQFVIFSCGVLVFVIEKFCYSTIILYIIIKNEITINYKIVMTSILLSTYIFGIEIVFLKTIMNLPLVDEFYKKYGMLLHFLDHIWMGCIIGLYNISFKHVRGYVKYP